MSNIIKVSFISWSLVASLVAQDLQDEENRDRLHSVKKAIGSVSQTPQKELDIVDGFWHMFHDGKVTGQIRSIYSGYNYKNSDDTYATALGGFVKYELAEYKGLSAGVEFITSNDIGWASGENEKRNVELSSSKGVYTQLNEAYVNYNYENFKLRLGRQTLDTPLADSDDIRMIPNSFEAYVLTYESDTITVMAGSLQQWQGYDADLDNEWIKTGEDGTYFGGLSYSNKLIDANVWYYNINGVAGDATANNSYYGDIVGHYHVSKEVLVHVGAQYLMQNELDKSGVEANIFGLTAELVVKDFGFNIAYNKSLKQSNKQSFSGFGGGTLFTNMDSMILDAITLDRDAEAIVGGISYGVDDFSLFYAYGDFNGQADSAGLKEHIIEQNIGLEYSREENFTLAAIYTQDDDKENSGANDGDWNNVRVLATYNF